MVKLCAGVLCSTSRVLQQVGLLFAECHGKAVCMGVPRAIVSQQVGLLFAVSW